MEQIKKDKGEERLLAILQLRKIADQVLLDLLVTIVGSLSLCLKTKIGHVLEKDTIEGGILDRGTRIDAEVVVICHQTVDEYRTGMTALESRPIIRL